MSKMLKERELQQIRKAAVEVAEEAGQVLMRFYRKRLEVKEKARSSLVTQADVKSEKLIQSRLQKKFPGFQFLGEESGTSNTANPDAPMWHVDPLDGTTNFVHGFPMFCVSIGLALGDTPIVGVIHIPTLGETFHGAHGLGAKLGNRAIKTSTRKDLSECLLTTGFAYVREEERLAPQIDIFERAHIEARAVRRPGAAAIDLAYVAAGVFDAFWERNLSSWDVCAGALLVQEAGGSVTDYSGKRAITLHGKEIMASNGHIHAPMRKKILGLS